MANWRNKLDLNDLWKARKEDGNLTLQQMGKEISVRIKKLKCYEKEVDVLEQIAEGFEFMGEDVEEFDGWLSELYDWGDQLIEKKQFHNDVKMCWIATSF